MTVTNTFEFGWLVETRATEPNYAKRIVGTWIWIRTSSLGRARSSLRSVQGLPRIKLGAHRLMH